METPSLVRDPPDEEADDDREPPADEVAAVWSCHTRLYALSDRIDEVRSPDPLPYRRNLVETGSAGVSSEAQLDSQACQRALLIYWNGRYRSLWTLVLSSSADPSVASSYRNLLRNVPPC
jgi:hypothetical protein